MSGATAAPASSADAGYRHEAFFYRDDAEFLAGTVPFVRAGLVLGEPVMVAVAEPRLRLVAAALGSDADLVALVDMGRLGANPARIIPAWRQFADHHHAETRPIRGIGEPIWADRSPAELVECQLHEALLNVAVGPRNQLLLRCPYDVGALDPAVIAEARRSHPTLAAGGGRAVGSPHYGGSAHVGGLFGTPLPEPPTRPQTLRFDGVSVHRVRELASARAIGAGLDGTRAADFGLAVHEVASNSIRYGGGRGTLRIWPEPAGIVAEVADSGHIEDPLVGRVLPAERDEGGRGLWLANHLCDLVQIRSTAAGGTTVRLHARTSGVHPFVGRRFS